MSDKPQDPKDLQSRAEETPPAEPATPREQPADTSAHELKPRPLDHTSPQFTLRAILTGMLLAAVLSACNIYTGLSIGWSLNMSITAALIGYGFWMTAHGVFRTRKFGMLENNINQTACSSGASVSSAGLVAPIPALAMLTGQTLDWHFLALWVFSVCLVGITVAIALRRQMLLVDKLPFVSGIASAETLRELYAEGSDAMRRVLTLVGAAVVASPILWFSKFQLPAFGLPGYFPLGVTIKGFAAKSLTLGTNATLLMYAVGGLIGPRAGVSMLIGSIIAWAWMAPNLIHSGHLRLAVHQPLAVLPADVELPPEPEGYTSFEPNKSDLVFKGEMTRAQRDELLAQADDPFYRQAVRKLYIFSQLELTAPLVELPPGVVLAEGDPVRHDAEGEVLVVERGLDRHSYDRLRTMSDDPAYQAALADLHDYFDYQTTRRLQVSAPLERMPRGLHVPKRWAPFLKYNKSRNVLIASGPVSDECVEDMRSRAEQLMAEHPKRRPACEAFMAALVELHGRADTSYLPPGTRIPPELAGIVEYDDATKTLRARGVLTRRSIGDAPADIALLRDAAPGDAAGRADYLQVVGRLVAGTQYRPVEPNFKDLVTWLLWPGVTLMVVASLTSFAFSWRSMLNAFMGVKGADGDVKGTRSADTGEVTRKWFIIALGSALVLSLVLQISLFKILWWAAIAGVLLTFVLAIVAARVSGETNITPVGAMGKVTQLLFGAMVNKTTVPWLGASNMMSGNLMAANVTGGAASQCADMLHDLKCGYLMGASPRLQALAQVFGALAGALAGSAVYLILIPNPGEQLISEEWAAPAVAAWKAVAELFAVGFDAIPAGTPLAMLIAGIAAIALAVVEKVVPQKWRPYMLSPASLGLAFVIHAHTSATMFIGAMIAVLLARTCKAWTSRYFITLCAGIIAGESLTGVGIALYRIVTG